MTEDLIMIRYAQYQLISRIYANYLNEAKMILFNMKPIITLMRSGKADITGICSW